MKKRYILGFVYISFLFTNFIQLTNAENGVNLHNENCMTCHVAMTGGDGSVLYTRKDRAVTSNEALKKQVYRCQSSLGLNWSESNINSVQQYLKNSFYKF